MTEQTAGQTGRNPKFVWQTEFESAGVKPTSGFVGFVMSNRDNGDGKGFWVSAETIAQVTGLSLRTVERAIAELLRTGWLTQISRGCRGRASRYRLTIPTELPVTDDGYSTELPANPVGLPVTGDGPVDQVPRPGQLLDQEKDSPPDWLLKEYGGEG